MANLSTDMLPQILPGETASSESETEETPIALVKVKQSRKRRRKHRVKTQIRSMRILKNLTPKQVDNFMASYIIYSLDWADENAMQEALGPDCQQRVGECLQDWYGIVNHMCSLGEVEKMYIPPYLQPGASVTLSQVLYEERMAKELNVPSNARLLDLGCGRGRVAAHMASITGAQVTGLNIDPDQIASAMSFNADQKLENRFLQGDFNALPLPFKDEEFDGFYQLQAFSLCKDLPTMCRELYRVLKPGARISMLDWASLPAFNPNDPHHQDLMTRIKPLVGAVGTPTLDSMATALQSAGFTVLESNNASIDGLQGPMIESADNYFRYAKGAILGGVRVGLLPAHFKTLFERFTKDGEALIEADKARLVTTSAHWLAEKPRRMGSVSVAATAVHG